MASKPASILVVGSCQARAITYNLRVACQHATVDYVELNATALSPDEIFDLSASYDAVVIFALDDAKFGPLCHARFRSQRPALIIPRIYFQGFHPDFTYVELEGRRASSAFMPYHLRLAISCALHGLPRDEAASRYLGQKYLNRANSEIFVTSRRVLLEKERSCDITVSDLIFDNSWTECPLLTFNHPSAALFRKWMHRICGALTDRFGCQFKFDHLAAHFVPFFDADVVLPVFPGVEQNKFPLMARSTLVRLPVDQEYAVVRLTDLIDAEYAFVANLDEASRNVLAESPEFYPELRTVSETPPAMSETVHAQAA